MLGGAGGGGAGATPDWKFSQVFGERAPGEEVQEADIISAVEFDKTGDHLATGDRGGRVVLFDLVSGSDSEPRWDERGREVAPRRGVEYRYITEFQSHEPEFDYLKSLEIEEKINKIRWCHGVQGGHLLLSTNDKTIKLWKVFEKKVKCVANWNVEPQGWRGGSAGGSRNGLLNGWNARGSAATPPGTNRFKGGVSALRMPSVSTTESVLTARRCRVYSNAHAYHINSISLNSDCETYISADDLRVNLWNLDNSNQSFNIVDIKPSNMEDLTEVITSAEFHPTHCSLFAYSSSKGNIRLADMRASALCDKHAKLFEEQEPPGSRNFFSEIIASISDIKFGAGGRYILSRDYLTLKLWDINMESSPVKTFKVHEHLRAKLCDLYENDSIFDKFECTISGNGENVATGSYSNFFRVFNCASGAEATLEASKTPQRRLRSPQKVNPSKITSRLGLARGRRDNNAKRPAGDADGLADGCADFGAKLLHLAWHPQLDAMAAAASNSLYIFYA
uniref:Serine/threonine-protein phosphatase 2A 55 kDa regulatory subunit B n=1 Tax=Pyramimonas obovata TaxID=1411642 RepID=A0A7S0N7F5_9CHLO|mmetsp:Transcript_20917/g.45861  ORF Transcript_20917/g.45861 Transcript_20917/m.45861 type:complete len:507 (+) Transcript_20917:342-1862(+)|eukprot:CAMPEP_0118932202 /NCGR_PEP_ID=MMETSP1169-20130426/9468_1 /TAXON_ID=36882 /ORGANISM="Pyramimonas obovata, Strain CCMP722" /LENGTH=506 /DNA_ID=CAMNT_0006874825 /DNA_START=344 /DNA_END=1864 /DNA_ORIENTATION=-